MRTVYTAVMNRLAAEVPSLKWIELNTGQLKLIEKGEVLPLIYPSALIGIAIPECVDITDRIQDCKARVSIHLLFDALVSGTTSAAASDVVRNGALSPYDVIADVYKALQGFETVAFNSLSRVSQGEVENERLFVYKLDFDCDFEDITAE